MAKSLVIKLFAVAAMIIIILSPRQLYTSPGDDVKDEYEHPEGYELPEVDEDEYCTTLEFIRLEYDVEKAARKIFDTPELDDFLGTRLFEGR